MNTRSRVLTILLLVVGLPCLLTFHGCINFSRWAVRSGQNSTSARSSPNSYGQSPAPSGDWLIVIDSTSSVAKPLISYLSTELPRITSDASTVRTAKTLPQTAVEPNVVWIELKPKSVWTPFYASIADRAQVIVTTGSMQPGPLPDGEARQIIPGAVAVTIDYHNGGHSIGLVGRTQMAAYRANLIGDLTVKAIVNAYPDAVR